MINFGLIGGASSEFVPTCADSLFTNPCFDTDVAGWQGINGTATWNAGGYADVHLDGGTSSSFYENLTLVEGASYKLTCVGGDVYALWLVNGSRTTTPITEPYEFVAEAGELGFGFGNSSGASVLDFTLDEMMLWQL